MLVVDVFFWGALMLCWTRLCVVLQVAHGNPNVTYIQPLKVPPGKPLNSCEEDTTEMNHIKHTPTKISRFLPLDGPCFLDDIFAEMSEGLGDDGELTNSSLTLFGICMVSDPSASVLLELAVKTSRSQTNGLEVLNSTVRLGEDKDRTETGPLELIFDFPQSPLLNPVLLLVFTSPLTGGNLDKITFTSPSLQPNTQAVCISEETQIILLKASEDHVHQKWNISVATKSPDMKESLKKFLIGGKSESNINLTPFLLFSTGRGTDTSDTKVLPSSQTPSFLCELRRFLGDVLPQNLPESPPLKLDTFHLPPPLLLGIYSSEKVLSELIDSSAPTLFYFTKSMVPTQNGKLALTPALLEEVRLKLENASVDIMNITKEDLRAMKRLERLKKLCTFPKVERAAGETQYFAVLLLKALQTVVRAYKIQRGERVTRADSNSPVTGYACTLVDLTVSLEKHLVSPDTANIRNCNGLCNFPSNNTNNHAILLKAHIVIGNKQERSPCCVPVAYDPLCVINWTKGETFITMLDLLAKECECR